MTARNKSKKQKLDLQVLQLKNTTAMKHNQNTFCNLYKKIGGKLSQSAGVYETKTETATILTIVPKTHSSLQIKKLPTSGS